MIEKELFALLRLGLGDSNLEQENLSDFIILSAAQWKRLGEIAQEQGVLGVMLDGVDCLEATAYSATRELSKEKKLEWIGIMLKDYEVRNQQQLAVIVDLQRQWAKIGLRMMVMKGQGIGSFYPDPKHRAPGDVDCYLFEGYAKGNEAAKVWSKRVDEGWYKHSVICYKGETIENHQYLVHTREGKSSKQLNQILTNMLKETTFETLPGTEVLLPPPMFNALFLTYHALSHFLAEGLRLKQILDWAVFIKKDADKVDWKEFYRLCDKFHFTRFACVMNDIAVNRLGVDLKVTYINTSPYTDRVLYSTIFDKEYVFNSGESGGRNRWHIIKNLFKYRWKYHEIYKHSIARQLWLYVVGYIFKTEQYV